MMVYQRKRQLIVVEGESEEFTLSYAGKILVDFGFQVVKVGGSNKQTVFDRNKKIRADSSQVFQDQTLIQSAHCVLLHEDQPGLQSLIHSIRNMNKSIIIVIVHRINQHFKEKFHDAQILALSGLLSHFGQTDNIKPEDNLPQPPPQLSSIVSAVAIVTRLMQALHNQQTGIIRFSMLHHVMYLGIFHLNSYFVGLTSGARGTPMLEGGAPFYRIYETKNSYICVGNIQTKFYQQMIKGLNTDIQTSQYLRQNQMNVQEWSKMIKVLQGIFKQHTTQHWIEIMDKFDTCMTGIYQLTPSKHIAPSPKLSSRPTLTSTLQCQPRLIPKL